MVVFSDGRFESKWNLILFALKQPKLSRLESNI